MDQLNASPAPKRVPWNKGKLTGAKPPLRPKHVWSIRTKLQIEGRARDLALFNLAIDSKLRGCDVVAIRVEDVAAGGYTADRAKVRQKKTGRPVRFELSEQTRQAVDDYLRATGKRPGEFLWSLTAGLCHKRSLGKSLVGNGGRRNCPSLVVGDYTTSAKAASIRASIGVGPNCETIRLASVRC
jgi:integrase